jgi:hypothetical protein
MTALAWALAGAYVAWQAWRTGRQVRAAWLRAHPPE